MHPEYVSVHKLRTRRRSEIQNGSKSSLSFGCKYPSEHGGLDLKPSVKDLHRSSKLVSQKAKQKLLGKKNSTQIHESPQLV